VASRLAPQTAIGVHLIKDPLLIDSLLCDLATLTEYIALELGCSSIAIAVLVVWPISNGSD